MSETEANNAISEEKVEEVKNVEKENVAKEMNGDGGEAKQTDTEKIASDSNELAEKKIDDVGREDASQSAAAANGSQNASSEDENLPKNLYEFTVKDIDGNEVSLSKYRGHPTLVVNVATNCGLTKSNYNQLNQLYEKYEAQGLRIAAFPCNQFLFQESGCDLDIKKFAEKSNVKFDMYAKVAVNGADAIPLYRWLKSKQTGLFGTYAIKWNFTKFLIDKEGNPIKRYSPTTSPSSIEPDIKALLE